MLLAAGSCPYAIAADATSVYWVDPSAGVVMKVPAAGGAPVTLASGQKALAITVDAQSVYWLTASTLAKTSLNGGTVQTLASDPQGWPGWTIAVDATSVYWVASTRYVSKMALDGGLATPLASVGCGGGPFAVDARSVYWADCLNVMSVPVGGGTATTLAAAGGSVVSIVTNQTTIAWAANPGGDVTPGGVMTMPVRGSQPTLVAASGGPGVAIDATHVYWEATDAVMSAGLAGGTPTMLAAGQDFSSPVNNNLALVGRTLYWGVCPAGGGGIVKLALP